MDGAIDVRHVLPTIRVPTLVLHRGGDESTVGRSRYVAAHIPGARWVELPGIDYFPFVGDVDAVVDEVEAFVTGTRPAGVPDHVLATVLAIEIAGAAGRAIALGDRRWADTQDRFQVLAARELGHFRGRELDLSGDRVVATFDGPARAIRCAAADRGVTAAHVQLSVLGLAIETRQIYEVVALDEHGEEPVGRPSRATRLVAVENEREA